MFDRKHYFVLGVIVLIVSIVVPVITNYLMFVGNFKVAGDEKTWIGYLGSFWGSVISGALTLIGVGFTINSSYEGIKLTLKAQKEAQERQIMIDSMKARLMNLYQPLYFLINEFHYTHGAHNFEDLTDEEKRKFSNVLSENLIYADSKLDEKYMEFRWALNSNDIENANKLYIEIGRLVDDEVDFLRNELKLPKLKDVEE
jgi:hypothetical protein